MGKKTIEFDAEVLQDLVYLAHQADTLQDIAAKASEVRKGATFAQIEKHVCSAIQAPQVHIERVLLILQNIYRTLTRMRLDTKKFVDEIALSLEEQVEKSGNKTDLKTWREAQDKILETINAMGADHPLFLARKAERLAGARHNIISEMRILTDLRPVFNQAGDQIVQAIVTHTLFIEYFDGMARRRIEFGLDAAEVAELRHICQRAEGKAVTLREALKTMSWPTHLSLYEGDGTE